MKGEFVQLLETEWKRWKLTYPDWESRRERDWKKLLAEKLPELGKAISTDGLFSYLGSKKVFDRRTAEEFKMQTGSYAQVSSMLKALDRMPFANFLGFCEALIETNQIHVISEFLTPELVPLGRDTDGKAGVATAATAAAAEGNDTPLNPSDGLAPPAKVDYDWKACIRNNFVKLTELIELESGLVSMLLRKGVIDDVFADVVKNTKGRMNKVTAILNHLQYRPDGDFVKFCEALSEDNQSHLVDKYLTAKSAESPSATELSSASSSAAAAAVTDRLQHIELLDGWLRDEQHERVVEWRTTLLRRQLEITEKLDPSDEFIDHLVQLGVMNLMVGERCREEEDLTQRVDYIMDHMHRRSSGDFDMFCEALRRTKQDHIVLEFLSQPLQQQQPPPQHHSASAGKDVPDTPFHAHC